MMHALNKTHTHTYAACHEAQPSDGGDCGGGGAGRLGATLPHQVMAGRQPLGFFTPEPLMMESCAVVNISSSSRSSWAKLQGTVWRAAARTALFDRVGAPAAAASGAATEPPGQRGDAAATHVRSGAGWHRAGRPTAGNKE